MSFSEAELLAWLAAYCWPFCRIGAFLLAAPILGTQLVSARIRLVLALMVTIIVTPLLPAAPNVELFSLSSLLIVLQQVIVGLAMGFVIQIVFHAFVFAGQIIAMKMGLGFASMNDPSNGVTVTVISQFYLMISTLLFLSLDGHLIIIDILVRSFDSLPVATTGISLEGMSAIGLLAGWMFGAGLIVALPVLTSILIVNIAFGVMSRSAPQMNVFTVGFPITLVFGLLLIWFSLTSFLPIYQSMVDEGLTALKAIVNIN